MATLGMDDLWNWILCFDRSEEANQGIFKDCDEDGETGLTWDELKHCEVSFSFRADFS